MILATRADEILPFLWVNLDSDDGSVAEGNQKTTRHLNDTISAPAMPCVVASLCLWDLVRLPSRPYRAWRALAGHAER